MPPDPSELQAAHLQLGTPDLPLPSAAEHEAEPGTGILYQPVDRPTNSQDLRDLSAGAVEQFLDFSAERGYLFERDVAMAGLASALGAQLVLFAGPSGRGKSILASMLGAFLAPDRCVVMEGRRQLLGPEDVVGFYSPLTMRYAPGADFTSIARLISASATDPSPVLIIDEINLSTIEGYLAPLVHGFSSPASEAVEWRLMDEAVPVDDVAGLPGSSPLLSLGPFLRVFGTINVDETAHAPSRKVASRACVMILGDPPERDLADEVNRLFTTAHRAASTVGDPSLLGDPRAARAALTAGERERLAIALVDVVTRYLGASGGEALSHRQLEQFASFSSWYVLLDHKDPQFGEADLSCCTDAAETWFAQFVLPSLPPDALTRAVELMAVEEPAGTESADVTSHRQGRRAAKSLAGRAGTLGLLGQPVDFWDRLS